MNVQNLEKKQNYAIEKGPFTKFIFEENIFPRACSQDGAFLYRTILLLGIPAKCLCRLYGVKNAQTFSGCDIRARADAGNGVSGS